MSGMRNFLLVLLLSACPFFAASLRIYHIDVEQADATLFVAPGGKTMLVDSGKNGHGSRIKAVMDQAGVSRIDFFVATHYHEDHYGGIDDLVNLGVSVLEAYDRGEKDYIPATKKQGATYEGYDQAVGEDAIRLKRNDLIPLDPAMTVKCISSSGVVIGETSPTTGVDEKSLSALRRIPVPTVAAWERKEANAGSPSRG